MNSFLAPGSYRKSAFLVVLVLMIALGTSIGLAAVPGNPPGMQTWIPYLGSVVIGMSLLVTGWLALKTDRTLVLPEKVMGGMAAAVLMRLAVGVFWYLALPAWGYGSPVEKAGYIMADAYARDRAAWEMARSTAPLWSAFTEFRQVDQYGGLLFLSAFVYRFLGGNQHLPLQMVVISASFSTLAVIFTWAVARKLWGERVAHLAAWIVVLFPDAIILGSSQMREAFSMTLIAAACYGLISYWRERTRRGLVWMGSSLLLLLPFSPPLAGLLLLALSILTVFVQGKQSFRRPFFWIMLVCIAGVIGAGVWLVWGRIAPPGVNDPISLVSWWFKQSARWQAHFAKRSSTLVRKIFKVTPDWTHVLILMAYGVLQPFLPAAVLDSGSPIWKGIAIWRSAGWTILLAFMIAAPVIAWMRAGWKNPTSGISLIVWGGILLASLRSGGDMWDNPRYRVAFISLQAGLAAWVWCERQKLKMPWLRWATVSLGIFLLWFFPWYLQRYEIIWWPIRNVFHTIGLGILSVFIYLSALYARKRMGK